MHKITITHSCGHTVDYHYDIKKGYRTLAKKAKQLCPACSEKTWLKTELRFLKQDILLLFVKECNLPHEKFLTVLEKASYNLSFLAEEGEKSGWSGVTQWLDQTDWQETARELLTYNSHNAMCVMEAASQLAQTDWRKIICCTAARARREEKEGAKLKGSPKQRAWATAIRRKLIAETEQHGQNEEKDINLLKIITSAHWWIENRGLVGEALIAEARRRQAHLKELREEEEYEAWLADDKIADAARAAKAEGRLW